ncbi:ferredoxin [Pseudomonas sp. BAY1663]|uniref:four-helix bundle copper-binding protein n=1 Tax=Pseudomonas sp. BAY1663 TaxID=1439940 RepID=UPI00042E14C9|nr:four-helix bundle copper-binding protein [Pseudomonas sp. BAY1663]EXF45143.1 ferredoxin [Pseudomonas sp. BAY1663]
MLNSSYQSCIQACSSCALACETCAASCLREEDVKMMARCIELDRDCADTCAIASVLMTRDSAYAAAACKLCAQVCRDCAEECAKHPHDHCQACARACRQCAEECERMAA